MVGTEGSEMRTGGKGHWRKGSVGGSRQDGRGKEGKVMGGDGRDQGRRWGSGQGGRELPGEGVGGRVGGRARGLGRRVLGQGTGGKTEGSIRIGTGGEGRAWREAAVTRGGEGLGGGC